MKVYYRPTRENTKDQLQWISFSAADIYLSSIQLIMNCNFCSLSLCLKKLKVGLQGKNMVKSLQNATDYTVSNASLWWDVTCLVIAYSMYYFFQYYWVNWLLDSLFYSIKIRGIVQRRISEFAKKESLPSLTRSGCAYLIQVVLFLTFWCLSVIGVIFCI